MSDIGEYCRQVEAHLTRVNGGHLVRIVGPGFQLVRDWAEEGIPLSAVFRGIEQKAERHRAGAARRPLRIEFCEADVRDVYETWRRAIGVGAGPTEPAGTVPAVEVDRGSGPARRSATRELERAAERLVAVAGRFDLPEAFRDRVNQVLDEVVAIRDAVKGARGVARQAALAPLEDLDRVLVQAARAAAGEALAAMEADAVRDLEPFRGRLDPDAWRQAIAVTVDRAVRAHVGLPDLSQLGAS